ncbi:cysteine desulfurase family protein [[Limnothrix rosea] IAM M-220]|uniref:cysteine desulfurase family protein n=1 Tax=[Limnothrix rosea] IAM M-220 TaxID=454133 RepID=UPI000966839B|nr:cysteine desulfurase family protein [[Limnothrix rosea] IAM M-220]OKH10888.1 cysteine desulfurase [[Limnothrix rosea] IAM M-220]
MQIYLDYSATTPPHPLVLEKVQDVCTAEWGNPSSLHQWGNRAATLLEMARMQVAGLIGATNPDNILFTAGGTEADNLAIFGMTSQFQSPQHLIISSVEHPAIAKPADYLEAQGWQVTRLPVDHYGRVNPVDFEKAIQPNTVLASIIYGQSEVGTLQPIAELGAIARKHNVIFHTDAVQAAGRVPINVETLPVDLLSLSSHKIYGLQGTGALYVRSGLELHPQLFGGGQENKLRSGTQGLPGIAAFGVAAELATENLMAESQRLRDLQTLCFELLADCHHLQPTGDRHHRLPHHISFVIRDDSPLKGLTGKSIVRQLNLAGIGISAGSACHSGTLSPSSILKAMGYSQAAALSGIRLSCGAQTQKEDIKWTAIALRQILRQQTANLLLT